MIISAQNLRMIFADTKTNMQPVQFATLREEKNFAYKFLIVFLNTGGFGLPGQKYKRLIFAVKCYLLYSFIFLTGGQIIMLKDCRKLHEYTLTVAYIFSGVFLNIITLIMHFKRRNVLNMLEVMHSDMPVIKKQNPEAVTGSTQFKNFLFSTGLMFYVVYFFACMSPYLFLPLSTNAMGNPNSLLIPCWYPWRYDTVLRYNLTIGLQFSWLFPLSVPCMLAVAFTVYFAIEVQAQYSILRGNLDKMKDLQSVTGEEYELVQVHFNRCIQHHQMILK